MAGLRHDVQLLGGEVRSALGRGEDEEHLAGLVQAGAERYEVGAAKYNGGLTCFLKLNFYN